MNILQWSGASIIMNLLLVVISTTATMDPNVLTDNSDDELVANMITMGLAGSPDMTGDPTADVLSGDEDNLVYNPFDAAINVVKFIAKVLYLATSIVLPVLYLSGPLVQGNALQMAIGGFLIFLLQMNNIFLILRYVQARRLNT